VGFDFEEVSVSILSFASPFNNGGSSRLGVEPSSEDRSDDARSDGTALKLLALPGATLLTIRGPKILGFRSSLPTTATPLPIPFPTLAKEDVDIFASDTEHRGFNVSSELRGEFASG